MRFILFLILSMPFFAGNLMAQSEQTTHAHSKSRLWKGFDVLSLLENPDSYFTSNGKRVYLYNVGTGRFMIEGGDWGMEGRLFYEDFGRQMVLTSTAKLKSEITENTDENLQVLVCNVPGVTKGNSWADYTAYAFTTVMDGAIANGTWNFERVEGETGDTYTYYMYTQPKGKDNKNTKKFYLGAAYGEWDPNNEIGEGNKKGCGYYVHIDDDRSCWTTAGQEEANDETHPKVNLTKKEVNGDMVTIQELYQWRLISEDEFLSILNEEVVGINPSISSLVPDRDFTRNSDDFFGTWDTDYVNSTEFDGTNGRYGYTWGQYEYDNNQQGKYFDEVWDAPVMLKKVFGTIKEAKYGYMSFEGAGAAYVHFNIPLVGWYQIEANTVFFGPSGHEAYLYVLADGASQNEALGNNAIGARHGYQQIAIRRMDSPNDLKTVYDDLDFPTKDPYKRTEAYNLAVGKALTLHGKDFKEKIWVYVDPAYWNNGYKGLTIGVFKETTTKTTDKKWKKNGVSYYYDTEWVCIDDIKVSYMGLAPAFFYEGEESLDYLVYDENKIDERPGAAPDFAYSGSVSLGRSLKKNQWNTFSTPIPLTGEQVRLAFGEDAKVLKLNSIGGLSHNSCVIDFVTVGLKPEDPLDEVMVPGELYLLKPTIDPVNGEDPKGVPMTYYQLGRNFFSVNPEGKPEGYQHYWLDTTKPYAHADVQSWNGSDVVTNGDNDGVAYVSYVQTPGYASFSVTSGIYNGVVAPIGSYAPKGSYAMSNNKMYELNKDTRIKGFRGWITLAHSIFEKTQTPAAISIDGIIEGDVVPTDISSESIVPVSPSAINNVYDLSGRKLNMSVEDLPKGLYIIGGKKMLVK